MSDSLVVILVRDEADVVDTDDERNGGGGGGGTFIILAIGLLGTEVER